MEKQKFIDITFVKQHANFDKVLSHYNLTPLVSRLGQLTLRCPFHNDTKPSLKITASKKGFHCFGCGAKGNVLDFVSRMEECDLREAAETLAAICGIDLAPPRELPAEKPRSKRTRPPRRPEMAVQTPKRLGTGGKRAQREEKPLHEPPTGSRPHLVDEAVNPPLRFALKLDPAHPYLTRRRLSEETIAHFGLGYAGKGLFAGRIAIPIHDEEGELVAYAGRWPGDDGWPDGEEKYKLPPNFKKSRVLYNLHRVPGEEHLVLVEGYFAVFRLHQAGIPAVALMGTSISPEQVELLKRAGVEPLGGRNRGAHAGAFVLCPRRGTAGRTTARQPRRRPYLFVTPYVPPALLRSAARQGQPDSFAVRLDEGAGRRSGYILLAQ